MSKKSTKEFAPRDESGYLPASAKALADKYAQQNKTKGKPKK